MAMNIISCSVYGCTSSTLTTNDPAIQYHYFPKHPNVAEQWMNACLWRSDQLDFNTARICSIHFDADSYTNEYKKSDYISGYYTKLLKFDAIPTLHLPYQSIIKTTMPEIQISSDSSELKPIIVYNITNASDQTYATYETATVIEATPETTTTEMTSIKFIDHGTEGVITHIVPFEDPQEKGVINQLEKYAKIKTHVDLLSLQSENDEVQKETNELEEKLAALKETIAIKTETFKKKEFEASKNRKQYNSLLRRTLSLSEQKLLLSKVFSESQIKILSGKKKIYWSNDDMAIGYTIRHMSNKRCYMYLSKSLNIPLPALSSIKRWATVKKNDKNDIKDEEKFQDSE